MSTVFTLCNIAIKYKQKVFERIKKGEVKGTYSEQHKPICMLLISHHYWQFSV